MSRVVCDTGPLITLEKIPDGFGFIGKLVDRILIPESVLAEIGHHFAKPSDYLATHGIENLVEVHPDPGEDPVIPGLMRLHAGEAAAIRLALHLDLPLLIEEDDGRTVAESAGLAISGIAGQILKASRQGLASIELGKSLLLAMVTANRLDTRTGQALLADLSSLAEP